MVNLTIDGKAVSVAKGTTILKAAFSVGIKIPNLCWMDKLSPTGDCRLCIVEIEGVERPMTSCNTEVKEGIVVTTQTETLKELRRQTLSLILVNHPLDCPVCDAAGECQLQNLCLELDVTEQPFSTEYVRPPKTTRWPLIQYDPARCVLCERCVKVCHELVGADALSISGKGGHAFIDKNLTRCTYCGNCVLSCPTGAMTSKPFHYKARPWALTKVPTICTYCPSQCQIQLNVKDNKILRVTTSDDTINRGLLCVAGFFGYDYVNSTERLHQPQLNQQSASWDQALENVAEKIEEIRKQSGPAAIAGLASPHLTNEENYLFQKLFRAGIGSNNIDSEARFGALRSLHSLHKGLGLTGASHKIDSIAEADTILVFGADPAAEAPLIDWKIQETVRLHDGKLVIANMRKINLSQFSNSQLTYKPGSEIQLIMGLSRLLMDRGHLREAELKRTLINLEDLRVDLASVNLEQVILATGLSLNALEKAADLIGQARKLVIVFGSDIKKSLYGIKKSAAMANLAITSSALSGGAIFPLSTKGNMQGILDMGVYPEGLPGYKSYDAGKSIFAKAWGVELPTDGLDADGILQGIEEGRIRMLYLAANNPLTFANSERWKKALQQVEFLVVQDIFPTEVTEIADVVLPGCSYAEKNGTFSTLDGTLSPLRKALQPPGECREEGVVFAWLLSRLSGQKITFDSQKILEEIRELSDLYPQQEQCKIFSVADASLTYQPVSCLDKTSGPQLLCGNARNRFGTTTGRVHALKEIAPEAFIHINYADAQKAGIVDGDQLRLTSPIGTTVGPAKISAMLPDGLFFAPSDYSELDIPRLLPDGCNRVGVQVVKL
jgi:formate dehydrogenase alpha subunit